MILTYKLISIIAILQVLDSITTVYGLSTNMAIETNPVVQFNIGFKILSVLSVVLFIITGRMIVKNYMIYLKYYNILLCGIIVFLTLIVINNLMVLGSV
jgi:hypothetical protein